jgi:hypothetical protein
MNLSVEVIKQLCTNLRRIKIQNASVFEKNTLKKMTSGRISGTQVRQLARAALHDWQGRKVTIPAPGEDGNHSLDVISSAQWKACKIDFFTKTTDYTATFSNIQHTHTLLKFRIERHNV